MSYWGYNEFHELMGKVISRIDYRPHNDEEILFHCADGTIFKMWHDQDCCESVWIEDVCGDLDALLDAPILQAEEAYSCESPKDFDHLLTDDDRRREFLKRLQEGDNEVGHDAESQTWTFYKLANINGSVTIRWYGSSNGYYSEGVSFKRIDNLEDDDYI